MNKTREFKKKGNGYLLISIITPAFNEADNLPLLYRRFSDVLCSMDMDWEWIVIDDHSVDETFATISDIAKQDSRVRGIRFSRNFGSHMAIACGLQHAKGHCAVIIAADLQDPPELLPSLLSKWNNGAQVVWAARNQRKGEKKCTIGFSRLYFFMMHRIIGIKEMPPTGADFFVMDRCVIDAFCRFNDNNVSIFALITWMGFRQDVITYDKEARLHGASGWNLEKKLKITVDSITSFTYLPIRLMSYLGSIVAFIGFVYAGFIIANALVIGNPILGWSSLMVVVLIIGGIQMLMMGVLGEYLWRALDEARGRPRYIIESIAGAESKEDPRLS